MLDDKIKSLRRGGADKPTPQKATASSAQADQSDEPSSSSSGRNVIAGEKGEGVINSKVGSRGKDLIDMTNTIFSDNTAEGGEDDDIIVQGDATSDGNNNRGNGGEGSDVIIQEGSADDDANGSVNTTNEDSDGSTDIHIQAGTNQDNSASTSDGNDAIIQLTDWSINEALGGEGDDYYRQDGNNNIFTVTESEEDSGDDTVNIAGSGNDIEVATGDGDDDIQVGTSASESGIEADPDRINSGTIDAGSGDDTITVGSESTGADITIDGGEGENTVNIVGSEEEWEMTENEDGTVTYTNGDHNYTVSNADVAFVDEAEEQVISEEVEELYTSAMDELEGGEGGDDTGDAEVAPATQEALDFLSSDVENGTANEDNPDGGDGYSNADRDAVIARATEAELSEDAIAEIEAIFDERDALTGLSEDGRFGLTSGDLGVLQDRLDAGESFEDVIANIDGPADSGDADADSDDDSDTDDVSSLLEAEADDITDVEDITEVDLGDDAEFTGETFTDPNDSGSSGSGYSSSKSYYEVQVGDETYYAEYNNTTVNDGENSQSETFSGNVITAEEAAELGLEDADGNTVGGDDAGEGGDDAGEGGDDAGEGGDNAGEGGDDAGEGGDDAGEGGDDAGEDGDDADADADSDERIGDGDALADTDNSDGGYENLDENRVVLNTDTLFDQVFRGNRSKIEINTDDSGNDDGSDISAEVDNSIIDINDQSDKTRNSTAINGDNNDIDIVSEDENGGGGDVHRVNGTGNDVRVKTNEGEDSITLLGDNHIEEVTTGDGDDTVSIDNFELQGDGETDVETIDLGSGNDNLIGEFDDVEVGTINSGDGEDYLELTSNGSTFSRISTGDADDGLLIRGDGNTFDNVDTGNDQDLVVVEGNGNTLGSDGNPFKLGSGDDSIRITGNDNTANLEGDTGNDVFIVGGNNNQVTIEGNNDNDTLVLEGNGWEETEDGVWENQVTGSRVETSGIDDVEIRDNAQAGDTSLDEFRDDDGERGGSDIKSEEWLAERKTEASEFHREAFDEVDQDAPANQQSVINVFRNYFGFDPIAS